MEHFSPQACHFQHLIIGYPVELTGMRTNGRVGCVHTFHIGIDLTHIGLEHGGKGNRSGIRTPSAQRGNIAPFVEALKSGKVKAYATDVWYSDPPDPACPLLTAPNVIMAPHLGASTKENLLRIGDEVVELLEAFTKK